MLNIDKDTFDLNDLKALMKRLRDPDTGCPWDVKQDCQSIAPHTIEEAYEVADAIERDDMNDLKDELGDLLFQIIFHTQMADEQNAFTMDDVIDHVTKKMIFRHPHVFGDETASDANQVETVIWEAQKAKEKSHDTHDDQYYLDTLTRALPSLSLANKIQKRVNKIGFEFPDILDVFDKLEEESQELKDAIHSGDPDHIDEELGDLLFVSALLARHCGIDAEDSLRKANLKFIDRFNRVETYLKRNGQSLKDATLNDMKQAWKSIKGDTQKP